MNTYNAYTNIFIYILLSTLNMCIIYINYPNFMFQTLRYIHSTPRDSTILRYWHRAQTLLIARK